MQEKLLNNVLLVLKNSLDEYFDYLSSYKAPSKVVVNYLVCETLRRCLDKKYDIQTGQKEKVDAYNRYIDVLITNEFSGEVGYILINIQGKVDNEKENHKIKSMTENNAAFGLLLSFSEGRDKEIRYRRFIDGKCLSNAFDKLS